MAALLNLPEEAAARELLDHWQIILDTEYDVEKFNDVVFGVFAQYAGTVVAQRRAAPLDPDDDMISGALATRSTANKLTDDQVIKIAIAMIAAGHFTTAEALGSAIHRVATVPGLQETLRSRPDLIPAAVEEMIRLDLPLHELGRMAATDIELHGRTIPPGCPSGSTSPPPTALLRPSTTPTSSSSTGARTTTSASATASTSTSVPRWPAWR